MASFMTVGECMLPATWITSDNKLFHLALMRDGTLGVYWGADPHAGGYPLWRTPSPGPVKGPFFAKLFRDGLLAICLGTPPEGDGGRLWESPFAEPGDYYLALQVDGNLCIYPGKDPPHNKGPAMWCIAGPGPDVVQDLGLRTVVSCVGPPFGQVGTPLVLTPDKHRVNVTIEPSGFQWRLLKWRSRYLFIDPQTNMALYSQGRAKPVTLGPVSDKTFWNFGGEEYSPFYHPDHPRAIQSYAPIGQNLNVAGDGPWVKGAEVIVYDWVAHETTPVPMNLIWSTRPDPFTP